MQDSDPDLVRPATLNPPAGTGSSAHFERIAPVSLDPARPTVARDRRIDGVTVSTRTLVIGLGLIVAIGALLFTGLPLLRDAAAPPATATDRPAPPAAESAAASPPSAPAAAAPAAVDLAAVATDEAALRARQQAQDIAARIDALRATLTSQAVDRWAAASFAAANAQTAEAAGAFDRRAFVDAAERYRAALPAYETLIAEAARQRSAAVAAASAALERGAVDDAQAALNLAVAIDANDPAVRRLQARIAAFPAVQAALQRAVAAEAAGDVAAATSAWRAVLAADADHAAAKAALARIGGEQAAARFRSTMAAALAALDGGRLDEADRELKAAARQRPGDAGIADAERRLVRLRRERQLVEAEAAAEAAVQAEDWEAAVRQHKAVLALDPSAASAQRGLATAEPRAALARRLDGHLAQPGRLSSEAVQADAGAALASARAIAEPGPRLRAQIERLDALVAAASTPVPVQLRSDGATEVTIYKVGAQGRFKDKQLSLRPGRHVAVGSRAGYVDVRVEFTVTPGRAPAPITIRCEEKL